MPGVTVPEVGNLQEVRSMLAEIDWSREWRQQGFEDGLAQGRKQERRQDLELLRKTLLRQLGLRFGPLPDSVSERLDAIDSLERLADLIAESTAAPSLSALGLS
jgi:hypothetical protein